jgi:hypothetical protein
VALFLTAGLVFFQAARSRDPHRAFDLDNLPGFDAHVYMAMAEAPRVFTLAPWGYRLLEPALVGALFSPAERVRGFEVVATFGLIAAGTIFFSYLRLVGCTLAGAFLGVAALALSPPVRATFDNPFLVEPFALAFWILALWTIEKTRAEPGRTGLALLALSLTKEIWCFALPLVYFRHSGTKAAKWRALGLAALLPSLLWFSLRIWGGNAFPLTGPAGVFDDGAAIVGVLLGASRQWLPEFALGGVGVFSLLALARAEGRRFAQEHGPTIAGLLALPLAASVYTGEGAATSFYSEDIRRLLIYGAPLLIALALRISPRFSGAPTRSADPQPSTAEPMFVGAALAAALFPLCLDSYRRVDLGGARDGPYVLGFARESLRTAQKLDRGERVVFDPAERRFAWGVSPPGDLRKLRFFLKEGFGPLAHYGIHDIRIRESAATLVVPSPAARPLALALTVDAREVAWMRALVAGERVAELLVGPQPITASFELPARLLFRGDNLVELRCENAATALPRILRIELRPQRGATP